MGIVFPGFTFTVRIMVSTSVLLRWWEKGTSQAGRCVGMSTYDSELWFNIRNKGKKRKYIRLELMLLIMNS